jgi:hypothetical protein
MVCHIHTDRTRVKAVLDEIRLLNVPVKLHFSLYLSPVDIKQDNPHAPSLTLHPHNPALVVSVASELSIQMGRRKCLSPWQKEGRGGREGEKDARGYVIGIGSDGR